jgi:hypothetical protein
MARVLTLASVSAFGLSLVMIGIGGGAGWTIAALFSLYVHLFAFGYVFEQDSKREDPE